jgi:hypothetical protein
MAAPAAPRRRAFPRRPAAVGRGARRARIEVGSCRLDRPRQPAERAGNRPPRQWNQPRGRGERDPAGPLDRRNRARKDGAVPRRGLEPLRPCGQRSLSPPRLPIPPPRRGPPAGEPPGYRPQAGPPTSSGRSPARQRNCQFDRDWTLGPGSLFGALLYYVCSGSQYSAKRIAPRYAPPESGGYASRGPGEVLVWRAAWPLVLGDQGSG